MSQMAPEPAAGSSSGKRSNAFTRKIGPLPMWSWLAIAAGVIVGFAWYENKKAGASNSSAESTTGAADVPQFINQTYVQAYPPVNTSPGGSSGAGTGTDTQVTPLPSVPGRMPAPVIGNMGFHRAVATGSDSLDVIAKRAGTNVATITALTEAHDDKTNLTKYKKYAGKPGSKLPKGVVFYVPGPGS